MTSASPPQRTRRRGGSRTNGFLLLPVAVTLVVVGALAFLMSRQGPMGGRLLSGRFESESARYVAHAGLAHAEWRANSSGCGGDLTLAATPIGEDSYTASVTAGGTTTAYSLAPDQDAWFRSDQPTTVNGGNPDQHIRFESGTVEQALFRFDLSPLPAGPRIHSATAWFYVKSSGAHPEGPLTLHRVTQDWSEADATWDSMNGQFDPGTLTMIPAQASGDVWVRVNLTAQLQAWVNGQPNYGVLLSASSEGVHAQYISREGSAAERPRLEVVVGGGAASPATIQATGTLANGVSRAITRNDVPVSGVANTVVLQPGASEVADSYIWAFWKTTNYGTDDEMWASLGGNNTSRSLLKFKIGAVPVYAKILDATLSLHHRSGNDPNVPVTANRITNAWSESFATWNRRENGTDWSTAGGDFDPNPISTTVVGPASMIRYEWDLTALVQGWVDSTFPNYGVALATPLNGATGERFDTSDHADPSRHPRLTVTYACECGTACLAPQGSGNLLMVVSNPFSMTVGDEFIRERLESWGYVVSLIQDDDSQGNYDAAIAMNDVVLVSESVAAANVGTKLTATATGVVTAERELSDELGIASTNAVAVDSVVDVVDASHYITRVFPAGPLRFTTASSELATMGGTLAPDAQVLAQLASADAIVVLDLGGAISGGGTAAGRRAMVPIGDADYEWLLGSNGELLLQRAIKWAMSVGESPTVLLVVGNAGAPSSKDSGRKALMESWGFTVTLIDDGDSQANFDTAAAAHDVVYVSGTIGGGALADKLSGSPRPIVNEFPGKLDNFGFSSGTSTAVSAADFFKTNASHYITEVFSVDPVTVFSASLAMPVPSGTIASGLEFAGSVLAGASQVPALVTLDAGALRWDGDPAPARRVHLPFASAETTQLTVDGETIMRRAIDWARGAEATAMGPIAHWKLDEAVGPTALDSTGNGHDGTWVGDPASAPGKVDGGLDFDGINDYVDVPHEDELLLTGGMTFIAWATTLDTSGGYKAIISKDAPGNGASNYWFGTEDDELVFGFWAGGSFRTVKTSTENLALGTWHHLAASFDNATDVVRLYVDGTAVQGGSIADEPTTESADLWIGRSVDGEYWDGLLDDVRIYDRVLSDSEISDLAAAAGGGGGGPGAAPVFESFAETIDGDNNSNSISVAVPAGTTAGDLLVSVVVVNRNNQSTLVADDGGWTLLTRDAQANAMTVGVWWRLAGGSEPASYDFSWGTDGRSYSWIMHFSGNDPVNPIHVWDKFGEGSAISPLSPAVTTTVNDTLILRIGGFDDDDITIDDPGMAGHTTINMQESSTGTGSVSGGAAYVTQGASGDSGTANFTLTAAQQSRTITIGIAPAP